MNRKKIRKLTKMKEMLKSYSVKRKGMAYKFRYDPEADVLLLVLKGKGKLSHAEEFGDIIVHFDKKGKPLFLEVLNASKIIPLMIQAMAKKEAIASIA